MMIITLISDNDNNFIHVLDSTDFFGSQLSSGSRRLHQPLFEQWRIAIIPK